MNRPGHEQCEAVIESYKKQLATEQKARLQDTKLIQQMATWRDEWRVRAEKAEAGLRIVERTAAQEGGVPSDDYTAELAIDLAKAEADLQINKGLLARQCDMARDAEAKTMEGEAERDRLRKGLEGIPLLQHLAVIRADGDIGGAWDCFTSALRGHVEAALGRKKTEPV